MYSSKHLLVPALLALGACSHPAPEKKEAPAPPLAVQTIRLARQNLPAVYEATGTVRARVTSVLSARLMGYLREVRVQPGDAVKAGQVVAVIEVQELDTALRQAQAAVNEARGGLPEVENAIAAAQAQLDLARSTQKRMESLFEQKSITAQEFDEVNAKVRMAEANLRMAQAKKSQLEQKIKQAEEAQAQVSIQKGYSEVRAPFTGIIVERKAEPGMLAAPGTPIAVLEQSGGYRLEAAVEESRLGNVRPGMRAEVRLDAFDRSLSGVVSEIVPALDPASRTFAVKIDLPGGLPLRSGLFGRARFALGEQSALLVPAAAVQTEGQLRKVYVVDGGVARARLVTLGSGHEAGFEVLSGLSEGEAVVTPLPAALTDGGRVEVRP